MPSTSPQLDRFGLMMIEQPLDYDDVRDHAALQRRLTTPICLDESIHTVRAAEEAIALEACRIINIKPGRVGGHRESIRLHDLCAAHGIPVWHGGMLESGIGRAHNIHLASLPNFTLPGDIAASRRYFVPDLIEPGIEVTRDGTVPVPTGPGIGVTVDWDRVNAATIETYDVEPNAPRLSTSHEDQAKIMRASCLRACAFVLKPSTRETKYTDLPVMRLRIVVGIVSLAVISGACKTAPVVAPTAPVISPDLKMSWILRLEDQRILKAPAPPPVVAAPVPPNQKKKAEPHRRRRRW